MRPSHKRTTKHSAKTFPKLFPDSSMAEELQAGGVCEGNLWINSTRNLLFTGLSPCSSSLINESFGWLSPDPIFDLKTSRISVPDHDWNRDLHHGNGGSPEDYYMDYPPTLYTIDSSTKNSGQENPGFPLSSSSYTYVSSLLENLFDDSPPLIGNSTADYSLASGYMTNQDEYLGNLSMINQPENRLQFAGAGSSPASFLPADQPQFTHSPSDYRKRNNQQTFNAKKSYEEGRSAGKKASHEPAIKRPRIETPSPLPTFKVRKEKLGDRVTALQQLVSPFGKTDTASVLHEAIEYIKFLHDQVRVLSDPYFKSKSPIQQLQQATQSVHDQEGPKQDLRSQGLCLMPILSTFPVAAETSRDFWTPTFGVSFR